MTLSAQSPIPENHNGASAKVTASTSTHGLSNDWRYESTVAAIESIIDNIENGEMELAEIFDQFSVAVQQLHECEVFLKHHRQQVDVLVETLTDETGMS